MKYLFINCVAGYGSTGRIIADTCRVLMAQGHECRIAFGRKDNGAQDIPSIPVGNKWILVADVLEARLRDNEGFTARGSTRKLMEQIRAYDPDVIWLHNLHGYYLNLPMLFQYLRGSGKEIRWTLHDCWPFTGHCFHFAHAGCERWKTGCHDCPQKKEYPKSMLLDNSRWNYQRKKELFTGIPNLKLYTPSNWMKQRIEESFLKEYPVEVVYNTVNREDFKPTPSDFRIRYGLENKTIVLGVSSVWYEQKGLYDFYRLAELLDERFQIVLIGLTPKQIRQLPAGILGLPRTSVVRELAEAYTAADLYVSPSTEESFGMTVLEASCCGTPAVVYQNTACEEIVHMFGGQAVPRGAEHLKEAIIRFTEER